MLQGTLLSALFPSAGVSAVPCFCGALLVLPADLALNPLSHSTRLLTPIPALPGCKQEVTSAFSAALELSQLPLDTLLTIHLASLCVCVCVPLSPSGLPALAEISPGNDFFLFKSIHTLLCTYSCTQENHRRGKS